MIKNCPVCHLNNWIRLYDDLKRCKYCSLVRANDHFFNIDTKKLYSSKYYNGIDYYNYAKEKLALQKNFTDRIKQIQVFKKKGILLDIGCAYGDFLKIANEFKFKSYGLEVDQKTAQIASKYSKSQVFTGDISLLKFKNNSLDIITMFDTIEHLKDPTAYLAKAQKLLKKDGIIVIETGDINSYLAKIQKRNWRLITPPTHLFYFSPSTLELLLKSVGFKLLFIKHVPFSRTLSQIIYRLTRNQKIINSLNFLLDKTISINTYDLMFVIAKKV